MTIKIDRREEDDASLPFPLQPFRRCCCPQGGYSPYGPDANHCPVHGPGVDRRTLTIPALSNPPLPIHSKVPVD